jgi:hypothetical protein
MQACTVFKTSERQVYCFERALLPQIFYCKGFRCLRIERVPLGLVRPLPMAHVGLPLNQEDNARCALSQIATGIATSGIQGIMSGAAMKLDSSGCKMHGQFVHN